MRNLDEVYTPEFFESLKSRVWRAEFICKAIADVMQPKVVIDVGCGVGDLIYGFLSLSIDAYGIESSPNVLRHLAVLPYRVLLTDLRKVEAAEIMRVREGNVAVCFNVAEHIDAEYTDVFLNNLTIASKTILFAASPEPTHTHRLVNFKSKMEWLEEFSKRQYFVDWDTVELICEGLRRVRHKPIIKMITDNLICCTRI